MAPRKTRRAKTKPPKVPKAEKRGRVIPRPKPIVTEYPNEVEWCLQPLCIEGSPLVIKSSSSHVPLVLSLVVKEVYVSALSTLGVGPPPDHSREDPSAMVEYLNTFNKCVKQWITNHPHRLLLESDEWNQPRCTFAVAEQITLQAYALAIPRPKELNHHYENFGSEVYGETQLVQMRAFLDTLKLTEKDVVVDMGSGVGQLVLFTSAYTNVSKVVGIELAEVPASKAESMSNQYQKLMNHYGKQYSPFELHRGSFLDDQFRDLILKEATVIFLNNYAFSSGLMKYIQSQLLEGLNTGVRVITSKEIIHSRSTIMNSATDFTCVSDLTELPIVTPNEHESNVSWTQTCIQFLLYTVDLNKPFKDQEIAEQKREEAKKRAEDLKKLRKLRREEKKGNQTERQPVKQKNSKRKRCIGSKKRKPSCPTQKKVAQSRISTQVVEMTTDEAPTVRNNEEELDVVMDHQDLPEILEELMPESETALVQQAEVESSETPPQRIDAADVMIAGEQRESVVMKNEVEDVVEFLRSTLEDQELAQFQGEMISQQLNVLQESDSEASSRVTTPDTISSSSEVSEDDECVDTKEKLDSNASGQYMGENMYRQTEMVF